MKIVEYSSAVISLPSSCGFHYCAGRSCHSLAYMMVCAQKWVCSDVREFKLQDLSFASVQQCVHLDNTLCKICQSKVILKEGLQNVISFRPPNADLPLCMMKALWITRYRSPLKFCHMGPEDTHWKDQTRGSPKGHRCGTLAPPLHGWAPSVLYFPSLSFPCSRCLTVCHFSPSSLCNHPIFYSGSGLCMACCGVLSGAVPVTNCTILSVGSLSFSQGPSLGECTWRFSGQGQCSLKEFKRKEMKGFPALVKQTRHSHTS